MTSQKASKLYNTFIKGLVTDASEIAPVENSSIDEDNCVLISEGYRQRRLGIDYEPSYVLSSFSFDNTDVGTKAITSANWPSVNDNSNRNFLVIQIFSTLHFYDMSVSPLSDGLKSFTVDLNSFLASGATDASIEEVELSVGRGRLFVSSSKLEPFYITYDDDTDTISTTLVNIKIRDLAGISDGLEVDNQPTTLSTNHKYNLLNQGWGDPDQSRTVTRYIDLYFSVAGKYPSNTQQWTVGKQDAGVDFNIVKSTNFGSTAAAKGRYILNPFYKDRSSVSTITGITVESTTRRPTTCCFYSGRIWWAGVGSDIYYSQILKDDLSNAGHCYQEADPTAEDINDLVDSDGGVIPIPDAIDITAIRSVNNTIIVLASNGVWAITGNNNSGFKATDYQVTKISSIGCISKTSIVELEFGLMWWSETGISVLTFSGAIGQPEVKSASHNIIQRFYNNIDADSKRYSRGVYDKGTRVVSWLFKEESSDGYNRYAYDRMLNFDTEIGGYFTYTISRDTTFPYVAGLFVTPQLNNIITEDTVVDGSDTVVDGSDTVVVQTEQLTANKTFVKYLTIVPNGASTKITFSLFNNDSFFDWNSFDDVGLDYDSYLITTYLLEGDAAKRKESPYIVAFFRRTETGWAGNEDDGWTLVNPSSCYVQPRWEWADTSTSNKWGTAQQAYRFRNYMPAPGVETFDNGFPVIVTKNRLRGSGRSLHLKFSSESGKNFVLLGWNLTFNLKSEE